MLSLQKLALPEFLALAVFSYLLIINTISLIAFAADKKRSEQGAWRIPEKHLLTLAMLGGSPAIYFGRNLLRHKTYKQPFVRNLYFVILAQAGLTVTALYLWFY